MMRLEDAIDAAMPYRGPCGLCGGSDARHRVLDAVAEMVRAGDPAAQVAEDYGLPEALVHRLAAEWPADEAEELTDVSDEKEAEVPRARDALMVATNVSDEKQTALRRATDALMKATRNDRPWFTRAEASLVARIVFTHARVWERIEELEREAAAAHDNIVDLEMSEARLRELAAEALSEFDGGAAFFDDVEYVEVQLDKRWAEEARAALATISPSEAETT